MGLFDQFLTPPETEQPAVSSAAPPATPAPAAKPGMFEQFMQPPPEAPPPAARQPEMRSYTPSWSEAVANKLQDAYMALGADPYTAGKFGRGTRDVIGLTPAGPLMSGADVQHYAGQGDYGKAAVSALGVLPAAPLATAAVRGGLNEATRIPLAAPSSDELLQKGIQQFGEYRGSNQIYPSSDVTQLVNDMKTGLRSSGQYDIPGSAPLAHNAIDVLGEKAKAGPFVTAPDMDELRLALSQAGKKGEPGGQQGKSMLYDYLNKTGDTTMQSAVGNYGAGSRGSIVDTILDKAARRDDTAKQLATQTRSAVESIEKRPRGFTQEEIDALDAAREGSTGARTLEGAANIIGGEGIAGRVTRAGVAGGLGMLTGPLGAGAALVPELASGALRGAAAGMRRGGVEAAGDLVRQRSPMFLEAQAADNANPLYYPGTPAQNFVMRNAITQALINRQRGQ